MLRSKLLAVAASAALVGGVGFASASLATTTTTAPVLHGCMINTTRVLTMRAAARHRCPSGTTAVNWNQTGPQGPAGVQGVARPQGPQGPAGPAGPSDLTVSATTNVGVRDDSGGNGNWAQDTFVRSLTITRHEAAPVSNCGGAATCWYYTGTLSDSGTFVSDTGAFTPNQGLDAGQHIAGTVDGNFTGGSHIEFYASSNAPDPSLVPSAVTGDTPSTGKWYQQFFPDGTSFSGDANLIDWSWTYNAPNSCEQWTDAYSNKDGQALTGAGDITGINHC